MSVPRLCAFGFDLDLDLGFAFAIALAVALAVAPSCVITLEQAREGHYTVAQQRLHRLQAVWLSNAGPDLPSHIR